ncbi:hypothetical protein AWN90_24630 [Nocardia terpenica]|uniref:Uncharacterized protein n=1 Tax=Nocardia terpenica TaxID=455432 RepID=A0A164NF13_9NOCA|nr:hypothetical protein AWN90_24630 [Nocardia terpenica]
MGARRGDIVGAAGAYAEVHSGQPSEAVSTWTLPSWRRCLPDDHGSTGLPFFFVAVGPGS